MCDCLSCSCDATEDCSRCVACRWTQFDPCPCVCPGCRFPDGVPALCALPGCFGYGYFDPLSRRRERCCQLSHEQMLKRLEICPSVMPDGHLISISVVGPVHDPPVPPVILLVSPTMSIEALIDYVFMVSFGHLPSDGDTSWSIAGVSRRPCRRWQVCLMPGADSVSTASSTLLFPFAWGARSRAVSEVGVQSHSVLRISARPSLGLHASLLPESGGVSVNASVDTSRASSVSMTDAFASFKSTADRLAVDRFAAHLQVWKRDMPSLSSYVAVRPGAPTHDSVFGASVDAIISSQLSNARAVLSSNWPALFAEVRPWLTFTLTLFRILFVFAPPF